MNVLSELVQVINSHKVKCLGVIGKTSPKKSLPQEFYELLSRSEVQSDLEAEQVFQSMYHFDYNYPAVRKRLIERLINTIFVIDVKQPQYDDYQRAYYNCWKKLAAAKILLGKSANDSAIEILHRTLKQARQHEFTEIIVEVTRILRLHYGSREGDISKFNRYNKLFKSYDTVLKLENIAEEYFVSLTAQYINKKSNGLKIYRASMQCLDELCCFLEKQQSYKLHLLSRLIANIAYCSAGQYQLAIENCQAAITFFQTGKYRSKQALQIFLHQLLACFLHQKNFIEGDKVVRKLGQYQQAGSINWFSSQHTLLLLALHNQDYEQAYSIYSLLSNHKRFRYLPKPLLEKFRIVYAYFHYLSAQGKIQVLQAGYSKFRLGKFLNEVPLYSKDKRGMNIPILIIQFLLLLANRKYCQAIDRLEAMEKYCYRHLKTGMTFRSNCFVRMLLLIPATSFIRIAAERKANKYLEKLTAFPIEFGIQHYEIEVIPYEILWQMALDSLNVTSRPKREKLSESRPKKE